MHIYETPQYRREYRNRKKELGLCSICTNPRAEGKALCVDCRAKADARRGTPRQLYMTYLRSAGYKDIEFALTIAECEAIFSKQCEYCGMTPSPLNGIDRKDNSVGYVMGNVVPACKTCNYAKRAMTVTEFKGWISRAYFYSFGA